MYTIRSGDYEDTILRYKLYFPVQWYRKEKRQYTSLQKIYENTK